MKICVVGDGVMGGGIVQAIVQSGYELVWKGYTEETLGIAQKRLDKNLLRLLDKEIIDKVEKDAISNRITTTLKYEDCKDCDIAIEVIYENMEMKKEVLKSLDEVCKPETILASNTSSLSITEMASVTNRPSKVIGMHFFNPVHAMKLVEVIKGQLTDEEVHNTIYSFAEKIGKVPTTVNEAPGFVVNRILIPLVNEGIGVFAEGVASRDEIDAAMKLGAGHPMGPLALADLIGLDVCLAIMEVLHNEFGDDKYRPHPLLRKMVRANLLGRKTKEGFYKY
ncbi:MAG: 3-hydroxybutyryl-CoA dehydrogenase [Bacteroidales bacterium]|jgi:3-hydroxybutyryl-CoA dehydrogenase|nr:3-hydroxybutyryl-CoA dehydrogenase [Bacteroidales bacterium]